MTNRSGRVDQVRSRPVYLYATPAADQTHVAIPTHVVQDNNVIRVEIPAEPPVADSSGFVVDAGVIRRRSTNDDGAFLHRSFGARRKQDEQRE